MIPHEVFHLKHDPNYNICKLWWYEYNIVRQNLQDSFSRYTRLTPETFPVTQNFITDHWLALFSAPLWVYALLNGSQAAACDFDVK